MQVNGLEHTATYLKTDHIISVEWSGSQTTLTFTTNHISSALTGKTIAYTVAINNNSATRIDLNSGTITKRYLPN